MSTWRTNLLCLAAVAAVVATTGTSRAVVGYVNSPYGIGDYLITNPLQGFAGTNVDNSLANVMSTAPIGTTVSLWDSATEQFTATSTFGSGGWSANLTLAPGTGALLYTPAPFTNTWVGQVLNFDGSPYNGITFTPPSLFNGPNGLYLLSSKTPIEMMGTNVFLDVLGRGPQNGEQFITMNSQGQESATTFENGLWSNGTPDLGVGQSAFFNIGPVPEPSGLLLGWLGFATMLGPRLFRARRAA